MVHAISFDLRAERLLRKAYVFNPESCSVDSNTQTPFDPLPPEQTAFARIMMLVGVTHKVRKQKKSKLIGDPGWTAQRLQIVIDRDQNFFISPGIRFAAFHFILIDQFDFCSATSVTM